MEINSRNLQWMDAVPRGEPHTGTSPASVEPIAGRTSVIDSGHKAGRTNKSHRHPPAFIGPTQPKKAYDRRRELIIASPESELATTSADVNSVVNMALSYTVARMCGDRP